MAQALIDTFDSRFETLTGDRPYPWQRAIFGHLVAERFSEIRVCDIPTGLGKTSVIAIWLLARDVNPLLPRRLVYVVNRRTVVDQTTVEVEKYSKLRPSLAVSTLRGQFADNREWSADPSREAVICGTVDMIGSRLLFSGYGVGYKGKPLHAGFLGRDVLIVHDEAHLEPAFQRLLEGIEAEQQQCANERGGFRVMQLSATARSERGGVEHEASFGLTAADRQHPDVVRRTHAAKNLVLVQQSSKLAEQLAATALNRFKDSGRPVLIFLRLVDDLKLTLERLRRANFEPIQLTGTMRGWERERLVKDKAFIRFLPEWNRPRDVEPAKGTVFLVCTSAGEVGVNISADHLVCDLSTFESMSQRFGRVNRFGLHADSEIHVIHPAAGDFETKAPDLQRMNTLDLLRRLNGNASPDALSQLDANDRAAAFSPMPNILPTTDILFDAWSLTSIRDRMPGRPRVEPYLHGIRDWEPPETQVAWREEVGVVVEDLLLEHQPEDLLEEYPLKPHELLRDRTERVWKELVKLAERYPQAPVWIVDEQGEVTTRTLRDFAALDKKAVNDELGGVTVLLPRDVGGLAADGTLDGAHPPAAKPSDELTTINNDVADRAVDGSGRKLRIRVWNDDPALAPEAAGMRLVLRIDLPQREDDEDAPRRSWHWYERPVPRDNSKNAVHPVVLAGHVGDVVKRASEIVSSLPLDDWIKNAVLVAAQFHDLGKQRDIWQLSIGRPDHLSGIWFGKSGSLGGRLWKSRDITGYRHEFGSLVDLQSVPAFQTLHDDAKDLVQHLIAAHHGQARPHFTASHIIDTDSPIEVRATLATEVPRRFARLQRRFGRWGLAYLESLLRAADWHASANPDPSSLFIGDPR